MTRAGIDIYSINYLIDQRKKNWIKNHDISRDREYINVACDYVFEHEELVQDLQKNPELIVELFFYIVDKDKNLTPFFLNEVQHDFIDTLNKAIADYKAHVIPSIKMLVLKGRQQGFTSLITAYQLASIIIKQNFEGFTCADEDSNSKAIFENKAKYPYTLLPEKLKPSEKYNNTKQLYFEKLHSSWEIKTASKNMGRSRTINFWHGSEAAFWKDSIAPTQASIGEALTKDSITILESTANGYNEYKDLWDSGSWLNCFYVWWRTPEYRSEFSNEKNKKEFENNLMLGSEWIHERCRWLLKEIKLDVQQVYWYWNKYNLYIDKNLIKQEYPCSPEEAFLSSGQCIFDTEKLAQRKKYLEDHPQIVKRGHFEIKWKDNNPDQNVIEDYKFIESNDGYIEIYKEPVAGKPYAIGGDTSGEGSDYFVGDVLDNTNKEQVAQIRFQFDEDKYAEQMYCLGKYYNYALIGVETNYSTYPVKRLTQLKYNRQYIRESPDKYTGELKKSYGFETNRRTRPLLIAELVKLVREEVYLINSITTIKEMLTFIKNEKGRPEAEVGKHDDCVMCLGIGHAISVQQTVLPEQRKVIQDFIEDDDREYADELESFFD